MKILRLLTKLVVYSVLICVCAKSFSQQNADRLKNIQAALPVLDKIFKEYAENNHFPGFVYGIIVDGTLVHSGTAGYTDPDKNLPATNRSAFHIASMTKSFTAMAILKLRDEGKLKLDDPVYLYIPEMRGQRYPTTDAPDITIRHLLTHAGGFPEDNPWGDRQLAVSEKELLAFIKKGISFSNIPGIHYEYSNLGFAILGSIIKKVSGEPYDKYITANILLPLGMTGTYWEYSKVPDNELAHGYRWLNNKWVEQPLLHNGSYGAMGGMITSIEDFSKYVALHLSAWPPASEKEKQTLKKSSLREMHHPWNIPTMNAHNKFPDGRLCPTVSAYGYGLGWTKDCGGRIWVGHSGGLPGFGSQWMMLPDYGIGIMSFSNLTYAGTHYVNVKMLDTLLAIANLEPGKPQASAILSQRKNELIKLLPHWNNAEFSGIFADNFFMDYFPDSLRKEASVLYTKVGHIIRINDVVPLNNLRGSFVIEGENADIKVTFTLTPENPPLIQEYHIREIEK